MRANSWGDPSIGYGVWALFSQAMTIRKITRKNQVWRWQDVSEGFICLALLLLLVFSKEGHNVPLPTCSSAIWPCPFLSKRSTDFSTALSNRCFNQQNMAEVTLYQFQAQTLTVMAAFLLRSVTTSRPPSCKNLKPWEALGRDSIMWRGSRKSTEALDMWMRSNLGSGSSNPRPPADTTVITEESPNWTLSDHKIMSKRKWWFQITKYRDSFFNSKRGVRSLPSLIILCIMVIAGATGWESENPTLGGSPTHSISSTSRPFSSSLKMKMSVKSPGKLPFCSIIPSNTPFYYVTLPSHSHLPLSPSPRITSGS